MTPRPRHRLDAKFNDSTKRGRRTLTLYGDKPSLLDGRPTVLLKIANRIPSPQTLEICVDEMSVVHEGWPATHGC